MDVLKVGILGLVSVMLAMQFKGFKSEYGLYMGAAACILIFGFAVDKLLVLLDEIQVLKVTLGEGASYIKLIFKAIGITYICEFCASICKDAGHGAVAGQIEVFGKLIIMIAGMPVLIALLQTIESLTG